MPTHLGNRQQVKQRIGALMQSSSWVYLTEDDQHDILKVATVCGRRSDGRAVVTIHWKLYLAVLEGRIRIRKYERQMAGSPA